MTAFVINSAGDRLLIASDTLGYSMTSPPKPLGFVSKIVPFPHLRAALFGRGALSILATSACHLMLQPLAHDFDAAAEALPEILRTVTATYAETEGIEDHRDLMLFEGLFAGWSASAGRMRVLAFRNYEDFEPVDDGGHTGLSCLPVLPAEYVPRDAAGLPVERQMVAVMHSLRRYLAEHPEVVPAIIGGEIEITEITKAGVSTRLVHKFDDYEQTLIAAGAVSARFARGDERMDPDSLCRVDDAVPVATGGNRAERRRAEKLARKASRRAA